MFGVFGHEGQLSAETWEYDGISWQQMNPLESPSVRVAHAMAYDQARSVVVLFGGYNPNDDDLTNFYETWEYDGITWGQR